MGCFFYAACRKSSLTQGYLPGVILLIFIIVGMCLEERFFCRNLCPMGAVFSASGASVLCIAPRQRKLHQRPQRMHEEMSIRDRTPEDGSLKVEGDCFQCQKCIDTCQRSISIAESKVEEMNSGFTILQGNFIYLQLYLGRSVIDEEKRSVFRRDGISFAA